MPIEVELPDGNIAEFPDDTSPDVIKSTLRRQFNIGQEASKPIEAPALAVSHKPQAMESPAPQNDSGALRGLGLGTRNVLEGLGGVIDAFINKPANAVNAWLGGDPNYFKNPGAGIADTLGLPKPENRSERLQSDIAQGAASMLPTLGLGLSTKAAQYAPEVAKFFGAMPIAQILSGASSGAASGIAREMGAGPAVQTAAALIGGGLPIAAVPVGRAAVNSARNTVGMLDRLSESGQRRAAGDALRYFSRNPQKVEESLANGVQTLVDGSEPTLAQATGDSGLSILEKGLRNTNAAGLGGDITERYAQQAQARRDALNPVLNAAKQRIDDSIAGAGTELEKVAPGYQRDTQSIGADMRQAYDEGYQAARAGTREAYNAIDPENTSSFDLRPLRDSFAETLNDPFEQIPSDITKITRGIDKYIKNGQNATYQNLQTIRKNLSSLENKAAESKDDNLKRIAGALKDKVDNYLENTSSNPELMGGAPVAQPGTQAYKDANAVARQAVDTNSWYNDLAFLVQHGLNREAVERLGGRAMVEEFNRLQPGLVRRNGTLKPDTVSGDLDSFNALTAETGGGTYFANGDDFLNEVLSRLGSPLGKKRSAQAAIRENTLQQNTRPHTGFTPEQARAFQIAKETRRKQGEFYEQGANKPLSRRGEKQGGVAIDDSAIPGNYFTPAGIESFMKSMGQSESARRALSDYIVKQAFEKGSTNGVIDPRKLSGWMQRNQGALNELTAPGRFPFDMPEIQSALENTLSAQQANRAQRAALNSIARQDAAGDWKLVQSQGRYPDSTVLNLSDADRATLNAVRDDAQRAYEAASRANVAGSPTAQLQRIEKEMDRALQGIPFLRGNKGILGAVVKMLNALSGNANEDIMRLLNRATLDPAFALKLMRGANTASKNPLKRFVSRPNTTAWNALKASGGPLTINAIRSIMAGLNGANQ